MDFGYEVVLILCRWRRINLNQLMGRFWNPIVGQRILYMLMLLTFSIQLYPILGGRFGTKYGAILVVISGYKEMICSVLGAKASGVYEGLKMTKIVDLFSSIVFFIYYSNA